MKKGFTAGWRLALIAVAVFGCFAGIGARLYHLHVVKRGELLQFVERARKQILPQKARRGDILDARGHLLATSRSVIELGVDPQVLRREDEAKWPELARLIGLPLAQLEELMRQKEFTAPAGSPRAAGPGEVSLAAEETAKGVRLIRWQKLREGLDEAAYEQVAKLGIKGVYGHRDYRRVYPGGQLAAHVVGYVNKESTAAAGVERHMDFYLRGQNGWVESERDGRSRELAQFRTREVPAIEGYDVALSLDVVVQHIIEEETAAVVKKFNPQSVSIIVSDPQSGFILGMANHPTFDLNQFAKAEMAAQRNIALTDILEPGSTFKIVASAAALNEGVVAPQTTFDCDVTSIDYNGRRVGLPRDSHEHGRLSVADIVGKSSNIGAAYLGVLLGSRRLYAYSRAFGFGEVTGFPFGGEVPGLLYPPEKWDGLTITRLPMGHAVGATPIQIHYAMGAIANGGVLLRPRIVKEVRERTHYAVPAEARGEAQPPANLLYSYDTSVRRRVVSQRTAEVMARMLAKVVTKDGTAPDAAILGFDVAGKTGTTQKIIDGQYSRSRHIGSFVGFFPANRPRLLISVIVDDAKVPTGGLAYGSVVAAPSFKRIGEQLIQYLDIKPADITANRIALGGTKP